MAAKLSPFVVAYIDCALWASTDDDGEPLDQYTADDLTDRARAQMIEDCAAFAETYAEDLALTEADDMQHGHDFWLTRNGHGAGFWDRGYKAELGRRLTDGAHAYGSCDLYVTDEGQIDIG